MNKWTLKSHAFLGFLRQKSVGRFFRTFVRLTAAASFLHPDMGDRIHPHGVSPFVSESIIGYSARHLQREDKSALMCSRVSFNEASVLGLSSIRLQCKVSTLAVMTEGLWLAHWI